MLVLDTPDVCLKSTTDSGGVPETVCRRRDSGLGVTRTDESETTHKNPFTSTQAQASVLKQGNGLNHTAQEGKAHP